MNIIAVALLWQAVVGVVETPLPPPVERQVQGPVEHFDLAEPLSRNRFETPKEPVPNLNRDDRFDIGEYHEEEAIDTDFQCTLWPNKKFLRCVQHR